LIDEKMTAALNKSAAQKNGAPATPSGKHKQLMISGRWIANGNEIMIAAKTNGEGKNAVGHNFQLIKLRAGMEKTVERKIAETWSAVN
jgi:hypothetical protein